MSFGQRITVEIVGEANNITPVTGPAVVHSPVLASCGVGQKDRDGGLVIVPGHASAPLSLSFREGGSDEWFMVDRAGVGINNATQQFVKLCRNRNADRRRLGQQLTRAMHVLGCAPEPAVLDVFFGAPSNPLVRLAIALRAGRSMDGRRGEPLNKFFSGEETKGLPPGGFDVEDIRQLNPNDPAGMQRLLQLLPKSTRASAIDTFTKMGHLGDECHHLLRGLVEHLDGLAAMPEGPSLPRLTPAMDTVAVALGSAIGSTDGQQDAMRQLHDVFLFLGGRFVSEAKHPIHIPGTIAPHNQTQKWQWLCRAAIHSAEKSEDLWRQVVDPAQ